ncbi:TetR/AcrR family transcriptional regulator [Allonocardiopsis opalescens]|uniref:TetR family transcriptional regulator n=1 Tax=Allonocardiopsis opalescens TaxID=1144618 RepID=A0A2T0Q6S6_9ACTN|nr:TetR/AcrR family transcriptional regulator [Allonocardiopsis opalescens]PRX99443.1 TetR family transcriptional regulator [Allonocardiopsis opalescens]
MRKRLSRQATIDAAVDYADAHGIDALSISALARHLHVSPPSLYVHLPGGIRELRAALCAKGHHEIAHAQRVAATGRSGGDALRAMAHAQRDYARARPALYAATHFAVQGYQDDEVRRSADEAAAVAADILAATGISGPERVHTARAVRSAVQGFCALEAAGVFALKVSADDSFEWLVDALVDRAVRSGATDRGRAAPR